jgi:hypothetical protein
MRFSFVVEVEIERLEGKFASRDEMESQLQEAIESANPDSLTGDNEGEYEVTTWEVSVEDIKAKR